MGTKNEQQIITICKGNCNLGDWITIVLKPLTQKILDRLGQNIPVYHLKSFQQSRVVEEERKNREGGDWIATKQYGVAKVTKQCTIDKDGNLEFQNYTDKKVMVMVAGPILSGMYVKYSDIRDIQARKVVLTAGNGNEDDE